MDIFGIEVLYVLVLHAVNEEKRFPDIAFLYRPAATDFDVRDFTHRSGVVHYNSGDSATKVIENIVEHVFVSLGDLCTRDSECEVVPVNCPESHICFIRIFGYRNSIAAGYCSKQNKRKGNKNTLFHISPFTDSACNLHALQTENEEKA